MGLAKLGHRPLRWRRALVGLAGAAMISSSLGGISPTAATAATGVSYVGRVGSATLAASSTSATLTTSQVAAGDSLLVGILLSSTSPLTGAVSVTDTVGNSYSVDRDQNDAGAGDRVLVLSARSVQALPSGGHITFTFPKSAQYHITVDEFAGVVALDKSASAWATSTTFNSGATPTTSQPDELLFGVVGNESGIAPTWASGWTGLPTLSIGSDRLGTAYRVASATGQYSASGSISGTWMAAIVTYTAGPPPENPPTAKLTVTQASTPALTVSADGSQSSDTDATPIATYSFDFGDGAGAVTGSAAIVQHTYSSEGPYTVTLVATDTAGKASSPVSANITVVVAPPPVDNPPTAKLSVTKSSSSALTVTADASQSTDTDASPIASYRFDFGDTTPVVTTTAPTATAPHTYAAGGTYTVKLVATDTANKASTEVTASVTVSTSTGQPIAVYVAYYDTHHSHNTQPKPNPWKGSSNTVFVGNSDTSSGGWDSSTVRVENLTGGTLSNVGVTVDIGSHHYALWGTNSIPTGDSLVLAQTSKENFDGSDTSRAGCYSCNPDLCKTAVSSTKPVVHVTVGGATTNYTDSNQVLNTKGADGAGCPYTGTRNDESRAWQRIG